MALHTLLEYRQAFAKEVGPFRSGTFSNDANTTTGQGSDTSFGSKSRVLATTTYNDSYLLVPAALAADQLRYVSSHDPVTGLWVPDLDWGVAPQNKAYEIHGIFDPVAIVPGLINEAIKHCLFVDEVSIVPPDNITKRYELTSSFSYLTQKDQVREARAQLTQYDRNVYLPGLLYGDVEPDGTKLYLRVGPRNTSETIYLKVVKPAYYKCATTGGAPQNGLTLDSDTCPADVNWVVARTLVEAWRLYKDVLDPKASDKLVKNREEAAAWFTLLTDQNFKMPPLNLHPIEHWGPTWR